MQESSNVSKHQTDEPKKKFSNFLITEILNENEANEVTPMKELEGEQKEKTGGGTEMKAVVGGSERGVRSSGEVFKGCMQTSKGSFDAFQLNRWLLWYRHQLQLQLNNRLTPHYRSNGLPSIHCQQLPFVLCQLFLLLSSACNCDKCN